MSLPPLITLVGPTASGKTDLAVDLAIEFDGEVINADSRQIYKEIDIASAKPKFQIPNSKFLTYCGVPHHLFDIVKPNEEFNVTHFKNLAIQTVNDVHQRGKLSFLVGGTGLWISAVVDNLEFPDVPPNEDFRKRFSCHPEPDEGDTNQKTAMLRQAQHDILTEGLFQDLIAKDPNAAEFVNPKNRRRIIRALEVIDATGKPFSMQRTKGPPLFRVLELGLTRPLHELEERIVKRVEEQMKEGLEDEARALFTQYNPKLPALSSISVREWKDYFEGKQTLDHTLNLIRLHNRQYAKRQMTWFKRDERIQWVQNKNEAVRLVRIFLSSPTPFQTPAD